MRGTDIDELVDYLAYDDPGTAGELLAYMEMTGLPVPRRILRNIFVPHWEGKTTEIDLLLIHTTGFYVVESKNLSGEVYGDESGKRWEARYPARGGCDIYKFDNPIAQNETHARALRQYLSFYCKAPVRSVVAYGDRCTLKCVRRTADETLQCHYRALHVQLHGIINRSVRCLSAEEVDMFYLFLLPLVDKDRDAHVQRLQAKQTKIAEAKKAGE
ncbi:MAG: NERD domain-containing protein [Oscillospiraceae bacterium]|nr:NERD domain-containing protein [Oscillospiraceae bacterium]